MPDERPDGQENGEAEVQPGPEPQADEQEAMRHFQEEISKLTVADHLELMMQSLASLAVDRLGANPGTAGHKDLDQARLAVDAFRALLGVLEGKVPAPEITAHRSVLSQLQMGYVASLAPPSAGGGDETA